VIRFFLDYRMSWLLGLPFLILIYSLTNTYVVDEDIVLLNFDNQQGFIFNWINNKVSLFVSPFIAFINATLISKIFNHHHFIEKNTYITGLLYIVLVSFFNGFYLTNNVFITHTFIILAISELLRLRKAELTNSKIFNAAFLFGVASCFYHPFLFCVPLLYVMIRVFQPFVFRDLFLMFSGLMVPFIYLFAFSYINGTTVSLTFFDKASHDLTNINILLLFAFLFFFILISLYAILTKEQKTTIKLRKLFAILIYWVLIGVGLGVVELIINNSSSIFSICIIPLSFVFTYGFVSKRWILPTAILFYALLVFSFVTFFI